MHILGTTGSGKTTFLHRLILKDIEANRSLLILDLRGDLVEAALAICYACEVDPARVVHFDLREKQNPTGFDPLFGAGEPYFRALNVLDVVAEQSESWGVQLAETLRNALLLLAEAGERLTKIESLFYDGAFRRQCLTRCTAEPVVSFWERFEEIGPDRLASYALPVLNKVSLLLSTANLRAMLGHPSPVDLGRAVNTPGSIILVSLAADELHGASRMMGSLMLSAITREVFARVEIPEKDRVPIRFYVDEFENFGMHDFASILSEGRRFGLTLVLAHQTLSQLSKPMRSLILGNVGFKVVFRVSMEDSFAMSKDMSGDSRSYDMANQNTGCAHIWNPNYWYVGAFYNGGRLFKEESYRQDAQAFARRVAALHAPPPVPMKTEFAPLHREPAVRSAKSSLEEWL